jgi:hypothetical protein
MQWITGQIKNNKTVSLAENLLWAIIITTFYPFKKPSTQNPALPVHLLKNVRQ